MLRFINGDNTQFEWLRDQIQGALKIFDNVSLPVTCTPNTCSLGFEFTPANGHKMYIDKNLSFSGNHTGFANLIMNGEATFESYDDMVTFIKELGSLYGSASPVKKN